MDYASEVCGYKKYTKLATVQHKVIKRYVRIGKTCPIHMKVGDSGWYPTHIRCKTKMLTLWNKLVKTWLCSYHSCETALVKLIDIWTTNMENSQLNDVIFVDLRKAFDLVDTSILLHKLHSLPL